MSSDDANTRRTAPPLDPRGYQEIGRRIGDLVATKQAAYGDSFGKSGAVLRALYPNGIPVEAYDDALTLIRVLDKLFRIATDRDAMGESPWQDIVGYGILAVERAERQAEEDGAYFGAEVPRE